MMKVGELIQKVQAHYENGLPFVVYVNPDEDSFHASFQTNQRAIQEIDLTEDGFVFVPFDEGERLFIATADSENYTGVFSEKIHSIPIAPLALITDDKFNYLELVSRAKKSILGNFHSKIVTSRCKTVRIKKLDLTDIISRTFGLHQNAFRFIWFHPHSGFWCGATPEVLLKTKGAEFSTMALAGTQRYQEGEEPKWGSKEIDEQKWVVDAIADKLASAASVVRVSSIKNHRAGSLVHLRTDFNGVLKKGCKTLLPLLNSLHPTPAVCGTPNGKAKEFILKNELYNRAYYTGFLGPIHISEQESKFYVNLRCMQLTHNEAHLYVGGGVTGDSNPEAEWQETQNKLQTMLQVIAPML